MKITTNNAGAPLYAQIYESIRRGIMDGELKAGDALPTVRGLAKDLRISIITTARAYRDLERDGYIRTVVGKGSFVADKSDELIREEKLREMENRLSEAADVARRCGVTKEEFLQTAETLFTELA